MKNNIILIGYMGCGKSTIGKQIARELEMKFVDTDAFIEKKEGRTISQIFATEGENYFRNQETACLRELLQENEGEKMVVSVGGGLPVLEENRKLLSKLGKVFYLQASPEVIYERLKGDSTRPLLQTENPKKKIREMITEREDKYLDAADCRLVVDYKSVRMIVEEIKEMLQGD